MLPWRIVPCHLTPLRSALSSERTNPQTANDVHRLLLIEVTAACAWRMHGVSTWRVTSSEVQTPLWARPIEAVVPDQSRRRRRGPRRPWHNAWLPNQAPRSRMLRSQLGGWACQARPLRLYPSLRNVHPESTSWKHQAQADGATFSKGMSLEL